MDIYHYKCHYCGKDYKPNRRRVQKYCCISCKNNSYNLKKKINLITKPENKSETNKPVQIDKISLAGVGNAAVGTLAVQIATKLFTSDENKPATKKDIRNLEAKFSQRYYLVKNLPPQQNGTFPFFDILSNTVIYFNKK